MQPPAYAGVSANWMGVDVDDDDDGDGGLPPSPPPSSFPSPSPSSSTLLAKAVVKIVFVIEFRWTALHTRSCPSLPELM